MYRFIQWLENTLCVRPREKHQMSSCARFLSPCTIVFTWLLLTGEMSHHEVLDAVHKGSHVILTRHSNSERGFLEVVAKTHLKNLMPEV